MQCTACKARRGEVLKLFSYAMVDAVDLLQQVCNAEFTVDNGWVASQCSQTYSQMGRFGWYEAKSSGRSISSSNQQMGRTTHEQDFLSTSATVARFAGSNCDVGQGAETASSTARSFGIPSASKMGRDVLSDDGQTGLNLSGRRMLVGQHLIVGDERKFMLMHLLRRRLCALSEVLEALIRAMQDLRMTLRRADSFVRLCDDDVLDRAAAGKNATAAEIGTRTSMKAAAKLYDIIDQLERIQV